MAVHFEYLSAAHTAPVVLTEGTDVEFDVTVPAGEVALALSEDDVVVITGSPAAVRALLERALAQLPEGVPA